MDGFESLRQELAALRAEVEQLRRENAQLRIQLAERDARIAVLEARNAELEARNTELEAELKRRGKNYRPKGNTVKKKRKGPDRRTKGHRQHSGSTRPEPDQAQEPIHHDVHVEQCPFCGGEVEPTGEFDDKFVEDLPEPKVEVHRYRRHVYRCRCCQKRLKGRSDLEVPGGTVGDRAKLLTVYGRAHLGISLGKTTALLEELFGLKLSRSGALGHLRWFSTHFDPVVQQLLALLRESAVVHADETGWRIDGKNVWCWLFANPQIAVFLIDHHRSGAVVRAALGDSLPGVLVTDFYAAYHALDCRKQRCLVHLLRELVKLREELSPRLVAKNIQPLIDLFTDAIDLGKRRAQLTAAVFQAERATIQKRFDNCWWRSSSDPDCQRIYARLRRHREELLVFLDEPAVPADNNAGERDIRSVAAARGDGGVNRTDWGAKAFGVAKSIVRTCQKSGRNFFRYALDALAQIRKGKTAPLPLLDSS
jgi:transposase